MESGGFAKSATNLQIVRASWGAQYGPPWSMEPTK